MKGEVKIIRFLSANDSGRVMNPLTYNNQVIGGIDIDAQGRLTMTAQ